MIIFLFIVCCTFFAHAMDTPTDRFQQAAYTVIETLRIQDAELCARISMTLEDSVIVKRTTSSPSQDVPQSPHVTLESIRQMKEVSTERELELMIKNLIKEQELTIQDNELALVRHQHGSLKWKVKCGATFAGAIITSIGTTASIIIVTLINRQC